MESMMMEQDSVEACLLACNDAASACRQHVRHCLEQGGEHAESDHIAMMLTCAAVCSVASELIALDSEWYPTQCDLCAQVCAECAEACEGMEDMEGCAAACERCAQACRTMLSELSDEATDDAEEPSEAAVN